MVSAHANATMDMNRKTAHLVQRKQMYGICDHAGNRRKDCLVGDTLPQPKLLREVVQTL